MAHNFIPNTFVAGTTASSSEVNENFGNIGSTISGHGSEFNFMVPIGGIIAWNKTFNLVDSGTTTSTVAGSLIDNGQGFTGSVFSQMVIKNTTDDTFTHSKNIPSGGSQIDVNDDIFTSGETYEIYGTPRLPDNFAELNGAVISDADSPYNGATLPNLNTTNLFLRGNTTSGSIGGNLTHTHSDGNHNHTSVVGRGAGAVNLTEGFGGGAHSHAATNQEPPFFEVVYIMRIK